MKKITLLVIMIVTAFTLNAQSLVKYHGEVNAGYSVGIGTFATNRVNIHTIQGVDISKYFSTGVGVGLDYYHELYEKGKGELALPLFNKTETECETDFERWIFVLNNMETLNRMPFKAQKAVFEKLEEIVDVHSLSEEDRVRYENSVNAYRDYLATIDYAAKKGVEEGFEDGLQKGIQEGIQEGIRKGQQEKALEIARSMKAMGMTSEQIMKVTGLSLAEIESLL